MCICVHSLVAGEEHALVWLLSLCRMSSIDHTHRGWPGCRCNGQLCSIKQFAAQLSNEVCLLPTKSLFPHTHSNILRDFCSIYEFKNKIKLWCEMANLSQDFIQQIEELERKFSITFTIYKKYRVIFEQVFLCPPNEKKHSKYRCE